MNLLKTPTFVRTAWRWAATLALALALVPGAGAAPPADRPQPGRFLLIFEMSPTLKKNLPSEQAMLDKLFVNNLQHELEVDDDLAVWTVDQTLHTGGFSMASWSPEDSTMYTDRLNEFLETQEFTRHASLAPIQPLLNRIVKNSERLTVLIFCDSRSRLLGTPYDSGVNGIITNMAARAKGGPVPLILVLRSYRGQFVGGSVNRSVPLNFPAFPELPKPAPEPAPVVKAKPAPVPVPPLVVSSVPSIIIVGTNSGSNTLSAAKPPTPAPAPPAPAMVTPPASNVPAAAAAPTNVINTARATTPVPAPVITAAPTNPAPAPTVSATQPAPAVPAPVPAPPAATSAAPEPVAPPVLAERTNSAAAPQLNVAGTGAGNAPSAGGHVWAWVLGGAGVVVAAGLVGWLVSRGRRPHGSLITTSMQDDPTLPRRR
jgi:hypothetical protein